MSVDVYLRELIDQKGTESKTANGLSSQEREFTCCESGRRATVPTHRFFLTTQLAEKIPTRMVISLDQHLLEHHLNTVVVLFLISNNLPQLDRRFASLDLH